MKNDMILVISDLHLPYQHKDTIRYLKAIKDKYSPTRIILTGDEIDHHAMSFHDSDPDLFSPGHELEKAIEYLEELYDIFPTATIMDSNHGSMLYRRGKCHGIPRNMLRSYNEVLSAPLTWKWVESLTLKLPGGRQCYFSHGMSGSAYKVAQAMGCSAVQGHRHSEFFIKWFRTAKGANFAMSVGAMLDANSLAAAYGRYNLKKTIYGHGIIIKGSPKLLPMHLTASGRWDKHVD